MNSSIKTKIPGKTLGNYAFAGSLFLHVGLIAVFSSWQWDQKVPEQTPPKVVTVRFIPSPSVPQPIETKNPLKQTALSPAQPKTTPPYSKSRFASRTPNFLDPTLSPVKVVRQMTQSEVKSINPAMTKPVAFSNTKLTPRMARQINPFKSKSNKRTLAQPATITNTPLLTAVMPKHSSPRNQSTVIHRRSPNLEVRASEISNIPTQTAIATSSAMPITKMIRRLPSPSQSKSFTPASITPEAVVKSSSSSNTMMDKLSALPRELPKSLTTDRGSSDTDLNGLRGLFTGRVRQQIANAKYYPRIARRRGMEGQPVIAFTLDRGGRIMKAALAKTSGYQLLDQAALEAVRQAAPYPEIPAPLKMDSFQFKLPISFILK
jgi:TonB family protein